jgi:hypothetical protein
MKSVLFLVARPNWVVLRKHTFNCQKHERMLLRGGVALGNSEDLKKSLRSSAADRQGDQSG